MKIIVHTSDAQRLADNIALQISRNKLKTWEKRLDKNGFRMYYHSTKSGQWEGDLFVKPYQVNDDNTRRHFYIADENGDKVDFDPEYGYLMGRFLEILIVHFSDQYNRIEIA